MVLQCDTLTDGPRLQPLYVGGSVGFELSLTDFQPNATDETSDRSNNEVDICHVYLTIVKRVLNFGTK
jgi:hypothetical protein